jgi:PAS domain-containing protein
MIVHPHHEDLIAGIKAQMAQVLENSSQGIYLYLDDAHKVCNRKFAAMLGYSSPRQWAATEAPLSDILEEDQDTVIKAYLDASQKLIASAVEVQAKNIKTEKIIRLKLVIAPISFGGHIFTAHFFSKIKP